MTTATVRTLDEAVVADLEAIMNEPGSVLDQHLQPRQPHPGTRPIPGTPLG